MTEKLATTGCKLRVSLMQRCLVASVVTAMCTRATWNFYRLVRHCARLEACLLERDDVSRRVGEKSFCKALLMRRRRTFSETSVVN